MFYLHTQKKERKDKIVNIFCIVTKERTNDKIIILHMNIKTSY